MLTRLSPGLPTNLNSVLRRGPPGTAAGRIEQLEQQLHALVEQNDRMLAAIQGYADLLNSNGALDIVQARITASHGIIFPATQNPSDDANTLDDYAEVTNWTPVASFATPGTSSFTPTIQVADATKIGREVFASFRYAAAVTVGTGSGNLQITGLPYTASSDTNFIWDGALVWGGLTPAGSRTQVNCSLAAGSSTILLSSSGAGAAATNIVASDVTGSLVLRGFLRFRV